MPLRRCRALTIAVAAGCALALPAAAHAAATAPTADSFYTPPASYATTKPGTVLKTRAVSVTLTGAAAPMTATQVLYRTTNQVGQPSATVATILRPADSSTVKLLSYQTAYDGLAATTRPSYALRTGDANANSVVKEESILLDGLLGSGYTLVTSDYEGPTDDYGAGRESGQGTLDGIRAAEHVLKLTGPTTPVALMGYSGGAIATMWAAQLQASYAPDLDVIGAAAGGIPVDFAHNLAYISGQHRLAGRDSRDPARALTGLRHRPADDPQHQG